MLVRISTFLRAKLINENQIGKIIHISIEEIDSNQLCLYVEVLTIGNLIGLSSNWITNPKYCTDALPETRAWSIRYLKKWTRIIEDQKLILAHAFLYMEYSFKENNFLDYHKTYKLSWL